MAERKLEVRSVIAIVALLVITLLGAVPRLRIANAEPIWFDEAQAIAIASETFPAGIIRALASDGNSPLFYLVEHFMVAPRGAPFRELRDRAISVIFGIALIPLSFVLGRALSAGTTPPGLALATWVAFAPIVVDPSTQARPYSLLMFTVVLLALAFNRVARANHGWGWYALAAASVFYLHTFAAFVLAAMAIVLFVVARRGGFARQWLLWHAAIAVLASPALLLVIVQVRGVTQDGRIPWARSTRFSEVPQHLFALLAGGSVGAFQPLVAWVMLGLFAAAMIFGTPAARMMGAAAALALVIAVVLSFRSAGLVIRYNLPIAILLVAAACAIFRALPALASASFIVLYSAFAITNTAYYQGLGLRSSSRAVANLILAHSRSDDIVMIVPDVLAGSVNYYLPPRFEQYDPPSLTRVNIVDWRGWEERFSDLTRIHAIENRLERARREGRRVWLVVSLGMTTAFPLESEGKFERRWAFSRDVRKAFDRHYATPRLTRYLRAGEGSAVTLGEPRAR